MSSLYKFRGIHAAGLIFVSLILIINTLSLGYLLVPEHEGEIESGITYTFRSRDGNGRETEEVRGAIEKGLDYLCDTQAPDGGWADTSYSKNCNTAGNCLRAIVDYDDRNPRWNGTMEKTVDFLLNVWHDPEDYQPGRDRDQYGGMLNNDRFAPTYTHASMYSHGVATAALVDYCYRTGNSTILPYVNESVDLIVRSQNTPEKPSSLGGPKSQGGWRYEPQTTSSDTSASGWNLHALVLAESLGIRDVPDYSFEYAEKWLDRCSSGSGFGYNSASTSNTNTAVGCYCMYLLGKPDKASTCGAMNSLLAWGPTYAPDRFYYTYHASLAVYLAGGSEWRSWRESTIDVLLANQRQDGSWVGEYGTVWGTAMALMILEMCIDTPTIAHLTPGSDTEGKEEKLEKLVRPLETVPFNITITLAPNRIEVPLGGLGDEKTRINLTLSGIKEGWEAVLETGTEGDGGTGGDGERTWWVSLGLHEKCNVTLYVTAPAVGDWREACIVNIEAIIDNDYGNVSNILTALSLLDPSLDYDISLPGITDEFLGKKTGDITPGENRIIKALLENRGDVNNSYHMKLDCPMHWEVSFDNGSRETDIFLYNKRYPRNSTEVNITVSAPDWASGGNHFNITLRAISFMHPKMGLGEMEKMDEIMLFIREPALFLNQSVTSMSPNPGSTIEFLLPVENNFHSSILVRTSFKGPDDMEVLQAGTRAGWTARFSQDTQMIGAGEKWTFYFIVAVPQDAEEYTTRTIMIDIYGNDSTGNLFHAEPVELTIYVNDVPVVHLDSPLENDVITSASVELFWSCTDGDDSQESIRYDIYLGEYREPLLHVAGTADRSLVVDGLKDGKIYYWKVIPHDRVGPGSCGCGVRNFQVNLTADLSRASLISPTNSSVINESVIELNWKCFDPLGSSVLFHIYLGDSPNTLRKKDETGFSVYQLDGFEDNTTYYWQIIPVTPAGRGICSSGIWSFTVDLPDIHLLEIDVERTVIDVRPGEKLILDPDVKNTGNVDEKIYFKVTGDMCERANITDLLVLKTGETKSIRIVLLVPRNITAGTYRPKIVAEFSGNLEVVTLSIRVTNGDDPGSGADDEEGEEGTGEAVGSATDTIWTWMVSIFVVLLLVLLLIIVVIIKRRKNREDDGNTGNVYAGIEQQPDGRSVGDWNRFSRTGTREKPIFRFPPPPPPLGTVPIRIPAVPPPMNTPSIDEELNALLGGILLPTYATKKNPPELKALPQSTQMKTGTPIRSVGIPAITGHVETHPAIDPPVTGLLPPPPPLD